MEELGEFSEEYKQKQQELSEKQQAFEAEERDRVFHKDEMDAAEQRRNKVISWWVIGAMSALVLILALTLL